MKNTITFGTIAVAILVVLVVVTAILTIILNDDIQIASAQSRYPPGYQQAQVLLPQANLQDSQEGFIPPGSQTDLERTLFSNGQQITTICHIPPGNPANRHTIQISSHSLNAHLAHGDSIGTCTA